MIKSAEMLGDGLGLFTVTSTALLLSGVTVKSCEFQVALDDQRVKERPVGRFDRDRPFAAAGLRPDRVVAGCKTQKAQIDAVGDSEA